MARTRASRSRRGRGGRRGRPKVVHVEPGSDEEATKTDDEQSTSEEKSSESKKSTTKKNDKKASVKTKEKPSSLSDIVEYPEGLGKRKMISFGLEIPPRKRKVLSLASHCDMPIINENGKSTLEIENDSTDEDETTYIKEGRRNFALDIANWLEKSLQEEHEKDKEKFSQNQAKAHLSLDERIRYECANG